MSFDLAAFIALRPYLYHLTAADNVTAIRSAGALCSATALAERAGRHEVTASRRSHHVGVTVEGATAVLRDQAPLHERNMRLEDGWSFAEIISSLNGRVFFWPGTPTGPIAHGQRHFSRYAMERPALMRLETRRLFDANPDRAPLFCKYNSGSPRWSGGVAAPRGPSTFIDAQHASFSAGAVVEVTFIDAVTLPDVVEWADDAGGPWVVG